MAEEQIANQPKWFLPIFSPDIEPRFQEYYATKFLAQIRYSLLLAAFLVASFGILDKKLITDARPVLYVRLGFCVPVVMAGFASSFLTAFRRLMQPIVATVSFVTGLGVVTMTAMVPDPARHLYYAGLLLVLMYVYTFIRLRFVWALPVALLLSAYYEALALFFARVDPAVLWSNTFVVVSCNMIGAAACYMLEDGVRVDFKQQWQLAEKNAEIQRQQQIAESLLLNTLPSSVAEELKQKGAVEPRYHDSVTILFTDFKGFTASTENMSAEELISRLNDYFTQFDTITDRYQLEKLKTVGDSYLCVGGLTLPSPSHAVDAVLAAFDIIEVVEERLKKFGDRWSIRIGLNTGPVISGIIGIRRFAYDVWGESVNLASRFESTGSPNKVNLSVNTFAQVKDFFLCEYRGKIPTREGREYEMYFAVGVLPELLDDLENGIPKGFARRYKTYFHRDLPYFPKSLLGNKTTTY